MKWRERSPSEGASEWDGLFVVSTAMVCRVHLDTTGLLSRRLYSLIPDYPGPMSIPYFFFCC